MRYLDIKIVEALKASQYRNLVKDWNKERYAEIFLNPKYKHDKNGYRVYIPIEEKFRPDNPQKSPTQIKIEQELSKNNYEIVDYIKGLARQIGVEKNPVKLGKLLISFKRQDLVNEFNVDKSREGTKSTYMVVISRHPYDIAGMSTDRGWTSCMNLNSGINKHYVPLDVKAGSVVAYVTRSDDINLKNPSGRLLIKPFVDIIGKQVIYFGIEERVYGTDVPGFKEAVRKWVYAVNDAHELEEVVVLKLNPKLYHDSDLAKKVYVTGKSLSPDVKSQIERVRQNPFDIFDIENPSEPVQLSALNSAGYSTLRLFRKLMSNPEYIPSERIQIMAIEKESDAAEILLNRGDIVPSDKVQMVMVSNDWRAAITFIQRGIKMSGTVVGKVVEQHPDFMTELSEAGYPITKEMLISGLRSNGIFLNTYYRKGLQVDSDVELAAIENGYTDVNVLHRKYKEKDQELPSKFIDAMAKASRAYDIFSRIIAHNQNNPNDIIPFTEDQLVTAMITDMKGSDVGLYKDVIDATQDGYYKYNTLMSENGWLKFLRGATRSKYIIKRLFRLGAISVKTLRELLPTNGFLLELIPDPTYEEQVAAIKNNPGMISVVPETSPKLRELQTLAVTLDPNSITSVTNPSVDLFKIVASFKERNWDEDQNSGVVSVYEFLTTLRDGVENSNITEEDKDQLVNMFIKSEPRRIIGLINYHDYVDFPVTNELQLIAVGSVRRMIRILLEHDIIPSTEVLIKSIQANGDIYNLFDRVAYINRRKPNDEQIVIDDAVYMAYLDKKQEPDNARWLLSTALQSGINPSAAIVDRVLEINPSSIVTVLAHGLDISDAAIIKAVKHGGIVYGTSYTFLSAMEQRYGTIPEQILFAMLGEGTITDGTIISNLLDITHWFEKNDQEVPPSVYKYAIEKDYRTVLILRNLPQELMQELKDYNYKVNGYWSPLDIGDMVRLSNPKATPKYKIAGMTASGDYKIEFDGQDKGTFPKERILKVNGIEKPADYDQKVKLFDKKFPIDAAVYYIIRNSSRVSNSDELELLNSNFQDVLKKYDITDPDKINTLKNRLKHYKVALVDQYSVRKPNDDDVVDDNDNF